MGSRLAWPAQRNVLILSGRLRLRLGGVGAGPNVAKSTASESLVEGRLDHLHDIGWNLHASDIESL